MGQREPRDQPRLIQEAISSASDSELRPALEGTIGDARSFCWATLRQFERYTVFPERSTPRDFGLLFAEKHMLLGVAHDAVSHVEAVETHQRASGGACHTSPVSYKHVISNRTATNLAAHRPPFGNRTCNGFGRSGSRRD